MLFRFYLKLKHKQLSTNFLSKIFALKKLWKLCHFLTLNIIVYFKKVLTRLKTIQVNNKRVCIFQEVVFHPLVYEDARHLQEFAQKRKKDKFQPGKK